MIRAIGEKILMALCITYVVLSFGIYVGTRAEEVVEQAHKDSHHEKDILQRTKRYALARVPLTYTQPRFGLGVDLDSNIDGGDDEGSYPMEKRFRQNSIHANPAVSHFREAQIRQIRRPSVVEGMPTADQLHNYRNLLQYYGVPNNENDIDLLGQSAGGINANGVAPMTDEELQTLLLLLGGYKLPTGNSQQDSRSLYAPSRQYFSAVDDGPLVGKRETGKRSVRRSKAQLEQPMSFENSANADGGAVFIGQKRSKRIGTSALKQGMQSSIRIKKETDPAVAASLNKVFAGVTAAEHLDSPPQHPHQSIPTTAISSNHQIPSPSSSVQKKAIDWSEYFGIDKRTENEKHSVGEGNDGDNKHTSSSLSSSPASITSHHNANNNAESLTKSNSDETTVTSPSSSEGSDRHSKEKSEKLKEKKDKSRTENDTEEKADRKWILKEFYKNLAMSTNVRKRKRESPATPNENQLAKLEKIEKKMEEAGDKIIWDALKYTGAHKDAQLSPEDLAQVKNEIIHKLSAAYSLEKVREAIDEFRQELAQLKDKQHEHY